LSHIVTIKTEVRDATAVRTACQRLKLPEPTSGKVKLFSGEVNGLAVQLPDWRYPVVCETDTGQVKFDNYNGRWGNQEQLDRFLQIYAVEATKVQARKKGHCVTEQQLDNGDIKLTVSVGGAV